MSNEMLSLFDEPLLPPDLFEGLSLPAPGPSPEPASGTRCARRVRFNAVSLSRGLGQILSAATRFGSTHARDSVSLFVYDDTIVLAVDYPRPDGGAMSLRYRIPAVVETNGGDARWMGVDISALELMQQLRNRLEQSDRYGVLAGEPLTGLEMHTTSDGSDPLEVRILPSTPGTITARVVRVLGGADPKHFEELISQPIAGGFSEFPADALLEAAAVTHPDVGVLIDARGDVGKIAGVGHDGVMVATFPTAPIGEPLNAALVMSARQANIAGHGQFAMTGAFEVSQKIRTNEHVAHTLASALAASLVVDESGDARRALARVIGSPWGDKVATKTARGSSVERAVRAASWVLEGLDTETSDKVGRDLSIIHNDTVADLLRSASGGDAAVARVAAGLLPVVDDVQALERTVAELRGEVEMVRTATDLVRALPTAEATERLRTSDMAVAAVRLMGTKSGKLTDAVLPTVATANIAAWWASFETALGALDVPSEAKVAILERRGLDVAPTTALLALPDALKRGWLKDAQSSATGRLGVRADGTVVVSMGDDAVGVLTIIDRAVSPDPELFPLPSGATEQLLSTTTPFPWSGTLYNRDLDSAASRVVGTGTGDIAEATMVRDAARTIGLVRWVSPDVADKASRQVVRQFENESDRVLADTDTVYLGEGSGQRSLKVARSSKEPAGDPLDVGTLRVFGLDVGGERLYLDVPVKSLQRQPSVDALAVALDAEHLHDFFSFVTRRGTQAGAVSLLDASPGGLRLLSPDGSRVALLPAIAETRIPSSLVSLVQAADVKTSEPILLADVMERVRTLPRRPIAERTAHTVRPPGKFVEWISIPQRKVAATVSRRRAYSAADIAQEEETKTLHEIHGFASDAVGRTQALAAVSRRLQHLDSEIQAIDGVAQMETPLFGQIDEPLKPDARVKQLRKLKARRAGVLAARQTLVQVSDAPVEAGHVRAGMAASTLLGGGSSSTDALFEETPGSDAVVAGKAARVPVKKVSTRAAVVEVKPVRAASTRRSS